MKDVGIFINFIGVLLGMFMLGAVVVNAVNRNGVLQELCQNTNGKYDFCEPITIYSIKDVKELDE